MWATHDNGADELESSQCLLRRLALRRLLELALAGNRGTCSSVCRSATGKRLRDSALPRQGGTPSGHDVWSSSLVIASQGAWIFDFFDGKRYLWGLNTTSYLRAFCVRTSVTCPQNPSVLEYDLDEGKIRTTI
jgi:hypothetical protein